jgi:hypothetical protein
VRPGRSSIRPRTFVGPETADGPLSETTAGGYGCRMPAHTDLTVAVRSQDNQQELRKRLAEMTLPEPKKIESELRRLMAERLEALEASIPTRARRRFRIRRATA